MSAFTQIETFQRMLVINKHLLDDELELHSEMFHHIGENLAKASQRVANAKDSLERVESRLYAQEKNEAVKMTVAELTGIVTRSSERIEAFEAYQRTKYEADRWQSIYDAWKDRGFALRKLSDLAVAGYFTNDSTYDTVRMPKRRHEEHEDVRRQVADARRSAAAVEPEKSRGPVRRRLID